MIDLILALMSIYLLGAFIAFIMWTQQEIEGYSVIWWPITLTKALVKSLWYAIRY